MVETKTAEVDPILSAYAEWRAWDAESFGRFREDEGRYYESEVGSLLGGRSRPRVLEIGFGNGSFLGWCLSRGFDCRGIEMIPEMVDRAARRGVETYPSLEDPALQAQTGAFDCVVAFDVLEHIEDRTLPLYFKSIAALLKVGGYLVARFPNGDSPMARPFQHGDLTHVTALGRYKIEQLARMSGLSLVATREPARLQVRGIRARVVNALENRARRMVERVASRLYGVGFHVPFSPNLVAVLQKRG
jgi:2-polyprenyl-3-methyl-5-hydroxy-6-metoxy-1,4-benzoquinol methylase